MITTSLKNPLIANSKILIIDDIPENIKILGHILMGKGLKVAVGHNGKQAVDMASSIIPDLILLDISMPEMDGLEACKLIKSNPLTSHIPVIFLTARTEIEDITRGFEMGAVDYVTKPFNHHELLSRVVTHLELKVSKDLLKLQNESLIELNKTKDKFFSIIAHDLKNPLTGLLGLSQFLSDDIDRLSREDIREMAEGLFGSSKRLFDLLNNLLEWARIQTGSLQVQLEPVNLKSSFSETLDLLKNSYSSKKVNIFENIDPQTEVLCDKNMLASILQNLLFNAIKFTNVSGNVRIYSEPFGENFIKIFIEDSGIGINKEKILRLFDPGSKNQTPGTANEEGTGLGLLLCKELIEKQSGTISVESTAGVGSIFSFTLPKV